MRVYGYTDKGLFRKANEDCILIGGEVVQSGELYYAGNDISLFCVADGVGGMSAGEVASRLVLLAFSQISDGR